MVRTDNLYELPTGLPIPSDDGACRHLVGAGVPSLSLMSTLGRPVDLSGLSGLTVVYCYPRTGRPDQNAPLGWNEIPGARGCTPQSCGFRDHYKEIQSLGARVFGLSAQSSQYQQEAAKRLSLPFELLSDESLAFARALRLPTFEVDSVQLIKRLTLIVKDGFVEKTFYPVFPPDQNAEQVRDWLVEQLRR